MMGDLVAHHLRQQRVELAEVAEHHMPPQIPGEAGRVDHRASQTPDLGRRLEDAPVRVPEALQLTGAGQPAGAGADDRDAVCGWDRHGGG